MEAQLLEMPRSASRPLHPQRASSVGPCGGWERGGSRCLLPSWRILRVDLLSCSWPRTTLPVCSLPSDQRRSSQLLCSQKPAPLTSPAFSLQPLLLVAPWTQVGTFTGGSSLEAGLPCGAPPGVGGQGRSRQGGGREPANSWAAERRPLQSLWTVWEDPLSPLSGLVNRHFKNYACAGLHCCPWAFSGFAEQGLP